MTPAVARARALLDTPPTPAVPGQLNLEHPMTERPATFPALAVPCPTCQSPAGQLCTSHGGSRPRRHDVHQLRTAAHNAAQQSTTTRSS